MVSTARIVADTFVQRVEFHAEIGSTNDRALELATAGDDVSGPVLIWALEQTAGRGRGSNRWWASSGALTFSLLVTPGHFGLSRDRWPLISLLTGWSVCRALQNLLPGSEIKLKWPNDVFLDGRKICGVLVEVPPAQSTQLVIGIGINVNNSARIAPEEIQARATALCDVTNRSWELADVLIEVLQEFETSLERLAVSDRRLYADWNQASFLNGRTVHHAVGERQSVGVCRGIAEDGALVLQTEQGMVRVMGGVITGWNIAGG